MSETRVTLALAAVAVIALFALRYKKKELNLEELVVLAMNVVGATTGGYIFVGAFRMGNDLSQNATWAGITGVCMVIYFFHKIRLAFTGPAPTEIRPQEPPTGNP